MNDQETDLWSTADNLRANSDLKSSEYAIPVLGLIFLKQLTASRGLHHRGIPETERHAVREENFRDLLELYYNPCNSKVYI